MQLFMCATEVGGQMEVLQQQLKRAGISFGFGAPAGPFSWRGKLEWYRDRLEGWDPSEKVILSDAWDVLWQGDARQMERLLPPKGILIAGEKNCWPDPEAQKHYPPAPTPWMFVNSGGIVGRAREVFDVLDWGLKRFADRICEDDQRFWTSVFLRQKSACRNPDLPSVEIDYRCDVFQTMFLAISNELELREGKLHNLRTGTTPHLLHWNGGSNWPPELVEALRPREEAADVPGD